MTIPFKSQLYNFINEYSSCLNLDDIKDQDQDLNLHIPFISGFEEKIDKLYLQIKDNINKLINLEKNYQKKHQLN